MLTRFEDRWPPTLTCYPPDSLKSRDFAGGAADEIDFVEVVRPG